MLKLSPLVLLVSASLTDGAKILLFIPLDAKSHQAAFRPIAYGLAEKGHDVSFYTTVPVDDPPPKLRTILVPPVKFHTTVTSPLFGRSNEVNHLAFSLMANRIITETIESIVQQNVVQDLIKSNEKYDLVISSASFMQFALSTLGHKFKVPTVYVAPVGDVSQMRELAGAPDNPSYMINMFSSFSDRMTFIERVLNIYRWVIDRGVLYFLTMRSQQKIMDKYLTYPGWESRPTAQEMSSDAALILFNSHHSLGYSSPNPPHLKEIGGINVVQNKSLPPDIQKFLDDASDGAIYFSLGSILQVSQVAGDSVGKAFVNVFGKMKQKILWKWEKDEFTDKPSNVLISKWFPQQDVLAHRNVKVFITQGGMMSTFEAVSRGVPLLGIPFFGDQRKNLKHATDCGYGIKVEYSNLTENSIQWALDELLYNPKFKEEAERRAMLFHDRPMKPLEEAIYWIEYVLRHGRALQPASISMPFYQLYLLDVICFVISFLVLSVVFLKIVFRRISSFLCRKKSLKKKMH